MQNPSYRLFLEQMDYVKEVAKIKKLQSKIHTQSEALTDDAGTQTDGWMVVNLDQTKLCLLPRETNFVHNDSPHSHDNEVKMNIQPNKILGYS